MLNASEDAGGGDASSASGCPAHQTGAELERNSKLTDEQLVGLAMSFLGAGYETTANTISCTSYLLALNPDIQEKLQSEIDSYFDDKPVSYADNTL